VTGSAYGINLNAKRIEHGGTNPGCDHIEGWWRDCLAAYRQGNKEQAYFYLGVMLHMIQDMGVPAHANDDRFGNPFIYHQGDWDAFDNFEFIALKNWKPRFDEIDRNDPGFVDPYRYYDFSRNWTRADAPNYHDTSSFSKFWVTASTEEKRLFSNREGKICLLTEWALNSAARALGQFAVVAGYVNEFDYLKGTSNNQYFLDALRT
jgi:hypothetical protein